MNVNPGKQHKGRKAAGGLEAARRADSEHLAHEQAQVPRQRRNRVTLLHLFQPVQPTTPCAASLTDVCKAPFHALASLALQPLALCAARDADC